MQQKDLEKKNHDLVQHFREKSKKHQKLFQEYQKIKQRQFAAGIESAADNEAEDVLHAAAAAVPSAHPNRHAQAMPSRAESNGSGGRRQQGNVWPSPRGGRIHTTRKYIRLSV